jgi:hypothetical protein
MSALRENALTLVATTTGIDATSTGSTELFTVPSGKTFIPVLVVIRITSFTVGSKATQAVASFGGNSATYDDFLNSITYTVTGSGNFIQDSNENTELTVQASGDSFRIIIETASDATAEVWAVDWFGYLY